MDQARRWAIPQQVARYTSDPLNGSLLILRQIQAFYVKIRYFKKADEVQSAISKLEKAKPNPSHA